MTYEEHVKDVFVEHQIAMGAGVEESEDLFNDCKFETIEKWLIKIGYDLKGDYEDQFGQNWTYEEIMTRYANLTDLYEQMLDAPYDFHDLGYTNKETEDRIVILSHMTLGTMVRLQQYFNGDSNYHHIYEWLLTKTRKEFEGEN